jgi:hypothetical protein
MVEHEPGPLRIVCRRQFDSLLEETGGIRERVERDRPPSGIS